MKNTMMIIMLAASTTLFSCEGNSQSKADGATTNTAQEQVQTPSATFKNISQEEFIKMQTDANTIVMDVRTAGEVAEGHIKGASVFADINSNTFSEEVAKLDKSKTILVYCRSGGRSARASQELINAGFKSVYNLNGGIMSWTGDVEK